MRKRTQLVGLGSVMAVVGSLLLAVTTSAPAQATLKVCEPTAGVGSVHHLNPSKPQPVDENVNVYVGGNFTRAVGAELEGKLVVNGNATIAGNARYDMGYVGGGSGIIPVEGADMVAIGGSLTINGTSVISVGTRTAADTLPLPGNVKAGGAITPIGSVQVISPGTVTANLGHDAALGSPLASWPDDSFSVLRDFATRNATGTAGTAVVAGGELLITGAAGANRHLVEIPGSALTGQPLTLRLVNIDPTDILVIKVTGPAADVRISDMFVGASQTPILMGAVEFGQRASRMLWEFPDATSVTVGGAQPPGSVLVPTAGSSTTIVGAGTNGRVWVAGDLTQNAAGGEFHSFPFLGDDDSTCGQPPVPRAVPLVSIGDYVWIDADGDGLQDAGEAPVAGVTVRLLNAAGAEIATDVTDANGYYSFTSLDASTDYTVVFPATVTVSGKAYVLTTQETTSTATGSNPDRTTGRAPVTTTASGNNLGTPNDADDPTIDAGYRPVVSVGDYLWIDQDKDGTQDAGENPVPAGTTVRLLGTDGTTVIKTTTTDANGYYVFTDLPGGTDYIVEFPTTVTVGGLVHPLTTRNAGGDDAKDSDANQADGRVSITTPASGSNLSAPGQADDPTIDAGFTPDVVSIGDYVWIDADRDGEQDGTEVPVAGVTVNLLSADGQTVVKTTTTDAQGFYFFADLPKSTDYIVEFPTTVTVGGATYVLTRPAQGSDTAKDSNPAVATGRAPVKTPSSGDNRTGHDQTDDPTIDAGFVKPLVSIGDYVWIDADRDGQQDEGEAVVPGAKVELRAADGVTVIKTTTTDANGYYAFTDLAPGTDYVVKFPTTVTVGGVVHTLTTPAQGATASDSNPAIATGLAPVKTPLGGANSGEPGQADDPTIDAGFVPTLVSIGDYVWLDADRDGIQDAGEKPVADVTVRLLNPDGSVARTTTTDAEGYYVFADLLNSTDFIVEFPTTVTVDGVVRTLTKPAVGDDRAVDSNAAVTTGRAPVTTPVGGRNSSEQGQADDPTIDAGFIAPLVSIGDFVWIDVDRDGQQDEGEPVVPGVKVELRSADGATLIATDTTDAKGYYSFTDLEPNTAVRVVFPTTVTVDGVRYQLTQQGQQGATDSNPAVDTGIAPVTTPVAGSNRGEPTLADDPTIDAGYVVTLVSIGDYVWIDADRDGIQDAGEVPVADATVTLRNAAGDVIRTTVTDANGYYAFTDLINSTDYIVSFPLTVPFDGRDYALTVQGAGSDRAVDSNPATAAGRAPVTTPATGNNSGAPGKADDPTIDAGYVAPWVSIGDYVWIDKDRDGVQDEGEKPVPGVTVKLLTPEGVEVATTTTDKNGYYVFPNLPTSTGYIVEFPKTVPVDGYPLPLTTPNKGGNDGRDSDADPGTGRVSVTTPASGSNSTAPGKADDPTIDAGYLPPLVSVGDYVWLDKDGDGVQDPGEKPLDGITVKLIDKDGQVVRTTTTDKDGYYVFTDLLPETPYSIEFPRTVVIGGVTHDLTPANRGGDDARDSDADPASGRISFTTPAVGGNSAAPGKADNPTLDAGFRPQTGLAATGGAVPWIVLTAALLLLLAGGGMTVIRRRREN